MEGGGSVPVDSARRIFVIPRTRRSGGGMATTSSLLKGILNLGRRGGRGGLSFDSTGHGDGLRRCVLSHGPLRPAGVDSRFGASEFLLLAGTVDTSRQRRGFKERAETFYSVP